MVRGKVFCADPMNHTTGVTASIDSARANLAGTFVNAFVNAGFGNDKLMVDVGDGQSYIYKNKDHGTVSHKPISARYNSLTLLVGMQV